MAAILSPLAIIGKHGPPEIDFDDVRVNKRRRSSSPDSASDNDTDFELEADDESPKPARSTKSFVAPAKASTLAKSTDSRPKKYLCDIEGCDKAFTRPCRLEEHKRAHNNDRALKCPYQPCEKTFIRDGHLRAHVKSCHSNDRNFVCDWAGCDKKFTSGQRLRRHKESHEKKEVHRCKDFPPCDETFRKHSTLQKHVDTVHLHFKPHRCPHLDQETGEQCTQNFDRPVELQCHEAEEHGAAKYWCSFCPSESTPVGFGTYHDLQRHIAAAHPPFCTFCGLVCCSTSEVKAHVEIHHKGVPLDERKKFACEHPGCGKSFTKNGNLKIHIQTAHTDIKRWQCGVTDLNGTPGLDEWDPTNHCDATYTAKQTLISHIKRHHLPGSVPKKVRKAQKSEQKSRAPPVSAGNAVSLLTGLALATKDTANYVNCIVSTCTFRFKSRKAVEKHARIAHGMTEVEISEAIMEREALNGGKFWIGGDDEEAGDFDEFDGQGDNDFTGLDRDAVQVGDFYAY